MSAQLMPLGRICRWRLRRRRRRPRVCGLPSPPPLAMLGRGVGGGILKRKGGRGISLTARAAVGGQTLAGKAATNKHTPQSSSVHILCQAASPQAACTRADGYTCTICTSEDTADAIGCKQAKSVESGNKSLRVKVPVQCQSNISVWKRFSSNFPSAGGLILQLRHCPGIE